MRVGVVLGVLLLCACQSPLGSSVAVATPKPFTTPQLGTYEIRPESDPLELARPLKIAVLPFSDRRKIKHPGVDRIWSKDAETPKGRLAQPREIRGLILRGLENGLKRWPSVRLIRAEELGQRRDAEVIVSGEIERCRVSASFVNYRAECALRVHLRDAAGRALTDAPISVEGIFSKRIYERPGDWRSVEPVPPNPLAPAVERALQDGLEKLLQDERFRGAFSAE